MEKFINPFSDYGFKRIFGQEINKDLLISFLNSLLENQHIVNITFLNPEMQGDVLEDRASVFDIFCENDRGEKFVVEMQQRSQTYFKDRTLLYATYPIRQQAQKGVWDYKLAPVYIICLLNFKMNTSNHPEKYRWDVCLMEKEINEVFYDKLHFIFFEMPKFTLSVEQCVTDFQKWLYVINNMAMLDRLPPAFNMQIFKKLKEISDLSNLTPEELNAYNRSWMVYNDYNNTMEYAKQEAAKEGMEEGKKEGLEEGKIQKGLEIARKMRENGFDTNTIAKISGLTTKEIEKL